jgi:hypothetical protein
MRLKIAHYSNIQKYYTIELEKVKRIGDYLGG